MFESAELGRKISKKAFEEAVPELRMELVALQQRLRRADFPVILLFGGVDGAGKSESVNLLNEWMDPRGVETNAYALRRKEESEWPPFWRYWRDLPPKGKVGLFLSAWYTQPILDRAYKRIGRGSFERALERIALFERVLADDGALVVKFWMHLGKKVQKKRLESLEKDPLQSWRVSKTDWERWKMYNRFAKITERALRRTSTGAAPWRIVEGADHRYRSLTVGTIVRDAIAERLERGHRPASTVDVEPGDLMVPPGTNPRDRVVTSLASALSTTVLTELDMTLDVGKAEYTKELAKLQGRVNVLFRLAREEKIPMVAVFEGWDAGGKGGAIRRLTRGLDARDYRVVPIAAPTEDERAHHYLWRFWRHLPRRGRITIFDRSWYGRVLVERVEGFATEDEWRRAYGEINDYEAQVTDFGTVLLKFWLHITPDEQLRRFEERQGIGYKQWKITDEDWRNREKWALYESAVQDMVERTSTSAAPWTLVEGNSKRYARLKVLRTVCDALETALPAENRIEEDTKKKR
jgi:polyphosphate:AMP phosphotransferase